MLDLLGNSVAGCTALGLSGPDDTVFGPATVRAGERESGKLVAAVGVHFAIASLAGERDALDSASGLLDLAAGSRIRSTRG